MATAEPGRRLAASVVVPTYQRPDDLARGLESLLGQSRLPDELLVIDDGALAEVPHRAPLEAAGVAVTYRRKTQPGVTESRNLGLELARGDVVFLSEDDVVLFPDYIERILAVFEADVAGRIAGVGGLIANERRGRLQGLLRLAVYLPLGLTALREGRLLRSGFAGEYGESPRAIRKLSEVDFLLGGVAAVRAAALGDLRFSSRYRSATGYGQGEDKDFSVRLARRGRLVVEPAARVYHYPGAKHAFDPYVRGRAFTLFLHAFFRDHLLERPWHWLAFFRALAGYSLVRLGVLAVRPSRREWRRVCGIWAGWRAILAGGAYTSL